MSPKMIIVAGPPGGGKSTLYPLAIFGVPFFNADDRAAELNGGSYIGLSRQTREVANLEFEAFVTDSIARSESFAIETTLRSEVTFEQADIARNFGFVVEMRYLALCDYEMHLERVKARADAGGHSGSEPAMRRIYEASLMNLRRAVQEFDVVWVYDNTAIDASHPLVLEARNGEILFLTDNPPRWLVESVQPKLTRVSTVPRPCRLK